MGDMPDSYKSVLFCNNRFVTIFTAIAISERFLMVSIWIYLIKPYDFFLVLQKLVMTFVSNTCLFEVRQN